MEHGKKAFGEGTWKSKAGFKVVITGHKVLFDHDRQGGELRGHSYTAEGRCFHHTWTASGQYYADGKSSEYDLAKPWRDEWEGTKI